MSGLDDALDGKRVHAFLYEGTVESWHAQQPNGQWIAFTFDHDIRVPDETIICIELLGEGPSVWIGAAGPGRGSGWYSTATSVRGIAY